VEGVYAPGQALGKTRGDMIARDSISGDKNGVKYTLQKEFQVVPRCCSQGFGKVNEIPYGPSNERSTACPAKTQTEWILRSVSRTSAFNRLP
jgi:hypothetical protein